MVGVVIANVAAGESFDSIMNGYHISREDIQAALYFAADMVQDRYIPLPEASWDVVQDGRFMINWKKQIKIDGLKHEGFVIIK